MRRTPAGAALTVAVTLLAGCSWNDGGGRDRDPANRPGYALPTGDHGGSGRAGEGGERVVTGANPGLAEATFVMIKGSDAVRVRAVDLGTDLYRISTPAESKAVPSAHLDAGTVLVGLNDSGRAGPAVVVAELSSAVRWNVRFGAGSGEQSVDLSGGKAGHVDFGAGTNRAEALLPPPTGTTRVTMSGGAGQLLVHLTGTAPVRVRAGSGAASVTVDGAVHSGVAGGTVFTPPQWPSATDRYDIDATAGVSQFTVDRR